MKGRPGIKKNNRRIFRRGKKTINIPSERYEGWEKELKFVILEALGSFKIGNPINSPVNLKLNIHLKNHSNEPDLSNSYQGIEDCLEDMGILSNDKLIHSHDGSSKVFGEKEDWFEVEVTFKDANA